MNSANQGVEIRGYRPADAERLAEVYRAAVRGLGGQAYSAEQVRVWAQHPEDLEQFRAALGNGLTLCAVAGDDPVAFGQLHPADHVAYLYCRPEFARRGLASAVLTRLEDQARAEGVGELHVEASLLSRPLFARFGYVLVEEERPIRHGVEFVRFKMVKRLGA